MKVEIFQINDKFRCGWCSSWLSDIASSAINHADQHISTLEKMREDAVITLTVAPKEEMINEETERTNQ